jgi:hypothetical protein
MRRILYLALGLILSPKLVAEDRPLVWDEKSVGEDWNRAIRDFRRDHNFGLLLGQTRTQWSSLNGAASHTNDKSYATELTVQYSFHIPWSRGFGYSLGTSSSIQLDQGESKVSTHYRTSLPGLELNLVWNASERFRFNLGMVYGWERVDGLRVEGMPGVVSFTEESLSGKFSVDVFWKLTWAVRIEFEETHFPADAIAKYDLQKSIARLRLGLIKHTL